MPKQTQAPSAATGIARIAGYPLPQRNEIPPPRVPWRLQASRAALLVHDMQRYFVAAFDADAQPIAAVIANIARLIRHCRAAGIPVFYTAQHGDQLRCDRGLQADFWGRGMRALAEDEAIVEPLQPAAGDIRLVKHRYSAFQRTPLLPLLQARRRDQLAICGVYAHIGCLLSAAEAFQHDVEPFLVADAVAAYSREKHDFAIRYVAECCGVSMSTDDAIESLSHGDTEANAPSPDTERTSSQTGEGAEPAAVRGRPSLTLERMRADIAAILHEEQDEIGLEDNLMDLGLDSMRVMTLLTQWNADAGVELEFADIAEHLTLAGWWQVVQAHPQTNVPAAD